MKKINLKGVTIQTWTRTVVLLIALVSQLLVVLGKKTETVDMEKTTEIITYIFTAVAAVWSWWKNNSFTGKAQKADALLHGEEDFEIPCGDGETSFIIEDTEERR